MLWAGFHSAKAHHDEMGGDQSQPKPITLLCKAACAQQSGAKRRRARRELFFLFPSQGMCLQDSSAPVPLMPSRWPWDIPMHGRLSQRGALQF